MARESMLNKRKQKEKNKAVATTLNVLTGKNTSKYNTNDSQSNETKFVTSNDTKSDKKNNSNSESNNDEKNSTLYKTENEINNLQYSNINVKQTKTIKIGSVLIKTTATKEEMDNAKRAAYHLRLDTIEKIQKCAKLSGLKKAELVDIILNNELTNILNKTENK